MTDLDFLHAVVDKLHWAAAMGAIRPCAWQSQTFRLGDPYFQARRDPFKFIWAYCEENKLTDWKDLSYLLVTYPLFDDKRELIEWLWTNGTYLIAIVWGFINLHTRTWDLTHAGIPTLTLTRRNPK